MLYHCHSVMFTFCRWHLDIFALHCNGRIGSWLYFAIPLSPSIFVLCHCYSFTSVIWYCTFLYRCCNIFMLLHSHCTFTVQTTSPILPLHLPHYHLNIVVLSWYGDRTFVFTIYYHIIITYIIKIRENWMQSQKLNKKIFNKTKLHWWNQIRTWIKDFFFWINLFCFWKNCLEIGKILLMTSFSYF